MKTDILKYFETDRSYRAGVSLVIKYSPKLGLKKQLNIHPESDYLKGCIVEELRELSQMKEAELDIILSKPVRTAGAASPAPVTEVPVTEQSIQDDDDITAPEIEEPSITSAKTKVAPAKKKKETAPVKKPSRKR